MWNSPDAPEHELVRERLLATAAALATLARTDAGYLLAKTLLSPRLSATIRPR